MNSTTSLQVKAGGGEAPEISPPPGLFLVRSEWGEHKVCSACGFRWHQRTLANCCPDCKSGMHWIEDHWTPERAEARAAEIDPKEVAAIRARFTADLEPAA